MLRSIQKLIGDKRKQLIFPIFLMSLDAIGSLVMYLMLYFTVIHLLNGSLTGGLVRNYTIVCLISIILRLIIYRSGYFLCFSRGAEMCSGLRLDLANHYRSLSLGYFNQNSSGYLLSTLTKDLSNFELVLTHTLPSIVKTLVMGCLILVGTFFINWKLALAECVVILIALPVLNWGNRLVEKYGTIKRDLTSKMISIVLEYIKGMKVFKSANMTSTHFTRMSDTLEDIRKTSVQAEVKTAAPTSMYSIIANFLLPFVLLIGSYLFLGGTIASELLVAFMLMSLALSALLIAFEHSYNLLKELKLATSNLEQAFDTKPLSYKEEKVKLSHFDITFENVDFSYNQQTDVLHNISFHAPEGSTTALIGPSGSGKSTVANLIARFWDVTKGCVRIGGQDIRELNPDGLLHYISEVFQENTLLSDTIYNNIKAGREDATEQEVIAAAKAAHCHEFIERLPNGYQTHLAEGGNTLSGGEKQRIAIARAILKDAPILLLDESTASLDADNEAKINQALDRLMKGKTVFVIKALLPADGIGIYSSTWLTAKLIEQDKLARSLVKETVDAGTYTAIEKKLSDVKDGNLLTGDCKFQWIDKLVNENVTSKKNKLLRSRFDKAATSKRWGKPIAIGMIVLGLICSMVIGFPLMGLFSGLISAISVPLANWLLDIGAAPFLVSLLCNAILTAVSFALQMASYVFGISLVFGLMEDVGYMARISYVFDDTMTKLGLQGKAIMPFLVSFGCNIGGITGTRVIDSWGQRVMTIALSWVVPCASTWGVVGLVSGTFFGNGAVVVVLALFAVAFLHIFITYKVFGRSLNKVEGRTGLIMELPPYHKPHWKSLFGSVFSKMGNVLSRALRIIICISVIFWLLSYSADGNVANSIIYKVGTFIEPVTSLFGLPWQLFIAFVASAMGKEASLGVMASLFNTGSIWAAIEQSATVDTAALSTSMLSVISRPEALAFLFAFFFNMPCLMALTATTQETHSMKWTVRIALYYVLTALIMATIAYHVGLVIF